MESKKIQMLLKEKELLINNKHRKRVKPESDKPDNSPKKQKIDNKEKKQEIFL